MRIYIDKFNFKMSKLNLISKHKRESYKVTYIYTPEGVYRVDRGHNLRKIDFIDGKIDNIPNYIDKTSITIDHGIIKKRNNNVSHIPFDHFSRKITINHYSLQENSPVNLIVELDDNNEIIEVYFILNSKKYASYSDADIQNPLIKEDVSELFNLLKYK
jgi:hypothetical protein